VFCGDVVKITNDQPVPADMVILASSDPKGVAYVETKNLDGETNLKTKCAHKDMQPLFKKERACGQIEGMILCEKPNNAIYKFEGIIKLQKLRNDLSLNADNLLLRGCILRNTEMVYGVVVYQGHDTKVMMNSSAARYKTSKLEGKTTMSIICIFLLQLVFSLIGAYLGADWLKKSRGKVNYLGELGGEGMSFARMMLQQCGTWILIFTNFVPISLMVTLELVKYWQGMFMQTDHLMFDQEQDM
jgi:phospholipid-transporting ATPase